MKNRPRLIHAIFLLALTGPVWAQQRPPGPPPGRPGPPSRGGEDPGGSDRRGGPRPEELGESEANLGDPGIVWYPILEDGLKEAKRTNKPILFMSVASQCNGISGVF